MDQTTSILQFICPDRPGLVAELAGWVAANGGNINHSDHHTDKEAGLFISRIEWTLDDFKIARESIPNEIDSLARRLDGKASISFSDELPRVAIFASKQNHCLLDLLGRVTSGELPMVVPLIISNHNDIRPIADNYGIEYAYVPVDSDAKYEAEIIINDLLPE